MYNEETEKFLLYTQCPQIFLCNISILQIRIMVIKKNYLGSIKFTKCENLVVNLYL